MGKIILVDKDVVALDNLPRQVLFSTKHVGRRKVEAAKETLMQQHVLNPKMEVEAHHIDAITNWQIVLSLIEKSSVVFNMIDVGDYFDIAV